MFKPKALYCENNIENYVLGRELLEKYADVMNLSVKTSAEPIKNVALINKNYT